MSQSDKPDPRHGPPVLIVTGASRGIGAACARAGARAGYRVVVNYSSSRDAALAVVADIEKVGGSAIAIRADVSRPDAVEELFAQSDVHFGKVTALINNAGIGGAIQPLEDMRPEALEALFRTNVYACVHCCSAAIRRMAPRHGGSGGVIVNISSAAARLGGLPGMVAYAASKGAIDSLTTGLAKEVGAQGIRVVGIRPGIIETDILEPMGGSTLVHTVAPSIPLGRVGQPEEIADAAIWLLGPQASYVHGTTIDVTGGR
ncbi:MAG: SDR family oxidoreductase [Rhodoferax sp.]|jgi:NAD(P)-dependent dehydrogenase (short-subunit alcohol dehydrogenase family)|nr:SDR family oxidoreductase [Rhodoferax sp.]